MRLWTSAILWGILAGIVLGFLGIPVPVPATGWWIWFKPVGFQTASVLSLGTLGFLIGLLVDLLRFRKKTNLPEAVLWINGFVIFALLISVVQIFRLAASDADENLDTTAGSVTTFYVVSQQLDSPPSQADLQSLATKLRVAGAKLSVVSRYYDRDRKQNLSMENVSAGLTTAGLMLVSSNPSDVTKAEDFIRKAGSTYYNLEKAYDGAYNSRSMQTLLNEISAEEPQEFKQNFTGY